MMYDLPKSVEVGGCVYEIRSDYRAVLDICAALSDPELSDDERGLVTLTIFYPGFPNMPPEQYQEAIRACFWFINCGTEENSRQKSPRLVDWAQDFPYIVAPVNRVCGQEIRAAPYMHWWTFLSYYYEIGGDCTFAQIVHIRDKLARGKPLDKSERAWYRQNRNLVDFQRKYTQAEDALVKAWTEP